MNLCPWPWKGSCLSYHSSWLCTKREAEAQSLETHLRVLKPPEEQHCPGSQWSCEPWKVAPDNEGSACQGRSKDRCEGRSKSSFCQNICYVSLILGKREGGKSCSFISSVGTTQRAWEREFLFRDFLKSKSCEIKSRKVREGEVCVKSFVLIVERVTKLIRPRWQHCWSFVLNYSSDLQANAFIAKTWLFWSFF